MKRIQSKLNRMRKWWTSILLIHQHHEAIMMITKLVEECCSTINVVTAWEILSEIHVHVQLPALSYFSNSSLSACVQLRPIGETLISPLRNSIKVPLGGRKWGFLISFSKLINEITTKAGKKYAINLGNSYKYLLMGITSSDMYLKQKLINFWIFSSPK